MSTPADEPTREVPVVQPADGAVLVNRRALVGAILGVVVAVASIVGLALYDLVVQRGQISDLSSIVCASGDVVKVQRATALKHPSKVTLEVRHRCGRPPRGPAGVRGRPGAPGRTSPSASALQALVLARRAQGAAQDALQLVSRLHGKAGRAGVHGVPGATGSQGLTGATGASGGRGGRGPRGRPGPPGPAGPPGPRGPAGPLGHVGPPGPVGPAATQAVNELRGAVRDLEQRVAALGGIVCGLSPRC